MTEDVATALVDELVEGYPAGKPAFLYMPGMRDLVGPNAFSTPFDSTKRRMKTLIARARRNCADMDAPYNMVRAAIAEEERVVAGRND
ncbi:MULTISPECIES: hypothetical protein [Roseobacteraceae]|jgi:hypothetical protein|uniref:Uncharacterized protein n=1 Tax=Pseudosulfitobacter pseudonitzschiae TaxID=1402135 RepID=A0A221K071_9RHOB|nr:MULTISPECIES: hypothetical protein [Roseobacteraceae]ASM72402.1 hypothetical protein SULPSESMR1_01588 [Pseudosulfitobacter pseudonitzschiae]